MIDKIYLDSSFVISLLVSQHPFHKKAIEILNSLRQSQLFVSLFVVDEVVFTLRKYQLEKKQIAKIVKENFRELTNLQLIGLSGKIQEMEDYLQFWQNNPLQATDAMHLFLMQKKKILKLATFDQDFINRQVELGITTLT